MSKAEGLRREPNLDCNHITCENLYGLAANKLGVWCTMKGDIFT
jgi:hypothetical protein